MRNNLHHCGCPECAERGAEIVRLEKLSNSVAQTSSKGLADRLETECVVRENHPEDYCPDLTKLFRECVVVLRGDGVAAGAWQPVETRPELDHQPGRQFILIEGSREHSGAKWYRQHAGEAYIRKSGTEGEMLQYREADILRLCSDGDIDPWTARVTHWMPGVYPHFPSALSSADRQATKSPPIAGSAGCC